MNVAVTAKIKAIVAGVSLAVTNLLVNYAQGGTPLPLDANGQLDWGTLLVNLLTIVVGTGAVYQIPATGYVAPADKLGRHEKP